MSTYLFLTRSGAIGAITRLQDDSWAALDLERLSTKRTEWLRCAGKRNFKPSEEFLKVVPPDIHEPICWTYPFGDPIDPHTITETVLDPGSYYPRIWRGRYLPNNPLSSHRHIPSGSHEHGHGGRAFNQTVVAASNLFDGLLDLFRVVEPVDANRGTYGHRIRDLLILSCTEIEANWRSILVANYPATPRARVSTNDYVKLVEPLFLFQWSANLVHYSDFSELSPFDGWNSSHPTKSLPWYDAYNAVKHDREENFARATLEQLIASMGALHILISAQWGPEVFEHWHDGYRSPFQLVRIPDCGMNRYFLPPVNCDDSVPSEWKSVRYVDRPDL